MGGESERALKNPKSNQTRAGFQKASDKNPSRSHPNSRRIPTKFIIIYNKCKQRKKETNKPPHALGRGREATSPSPPRHRLLHAALPAPRRLYYSLMPLRPPRHLPIPPLSTQNPHTPGRRPAAGTGRLLQQAGSGGRELLAAAAVVRDRGGAPSCAGSCASAASSTGFWFN